MARYVLYGSQQEHAADCQKYPLQQIPRFTMLDTNVVECLVRFSECVFEQAAIPEHVDDTRRRDVEASMHFFW